MYKGWQFEFYKILFLKTENHLASDLTHYFQGTIEEFIKIPKLKLLSNWATS